MLAAQQRLHLQVPCATGGRSASLPRAMRHPWPQAKCLRRKHKSFASWRCIESECVRAHLGSPEHPVSPGHFSSLCFCTLCLPSGRGASHTLLAALINCNFLPLRLINVICDSCRLKAKSCLPSGLQPWLLQKQREGLCPNPAGMLQPGGTTAPSCQSPFLTLQLLFL